MFTHFVARVGRVPLARGCKWCKSRAAVMGRLLRNYTTTKSWYKRTNGGGGELTKRRYWCKSEGFHCFLSHSYISLPPWQSKSCKCVFVCVCAMRNYPRQNIPSYTPTPLQSPEYILTKIPPLFYTHWQPILDKNRKNFEQHFWIKSSHCSLQSCSYFTGKILPPVQFKQWWLNCLFEVCDFTFCL